MKDCEKLEIYSADNRKAHMDSLNRLLQKSITPEPSLLGSSLLSNDVTLNSVSSKTDPDFCNLARKPSRILRECLTAQVSEKDRKILHLMARRRETKMEESEVAFLARTVWEEERAEQAKRAEMNKASLMELLARKKEVEDLENELRRNSRNESLKQEKMILEMRLSEKHGRVERRQKELWQKKLKPETMSTRYQLLLHQELKKQKEEEEEMEKDLHVRELEVKGKRSEEKVKCVLMEKVRKLREESLKQELRWEAAKNARDELVRRWEEEKIRQMRYSERNQMIRGERVSWAKEWRRKIVSEKNERERQQHAVTYSRVKEEEKERLNRMRRKIQAKDLKSKVFREKREEAILRSRNNARTAAELRQKIRLSYTL